MKKGFVLTENFRRLVQAQAEVERRGAREAGLVIVKARYGVGKSALIARWAADNNLLFVRCMETWSKKALLTAMAKALGVDHNDSNAEVQARIIGALGQSMVSLVFDEADFLLRDSGKSAALLECIRDITDTCGIACFLVGMEKFGDKVARHEHIASRVNRVIELQPNSAADVKATCEKLADIEIAPDLVAQLTHETQGSMRLLLNAIANIEQLAETNGLRRMTAEHVRGKPLCVEFKARTFGRRSAP